MKKLTLLLILFSLLTACAAPPADIPTASPGPSATQTLTPEDTSTALSASLTPDTSTPDTPTRTPLPTIPTFTPTFDVRTIVTATPAPKAECPKENPNLNPDLHLKEITACENAAMKAMGNPFECVNREMGSLVAEYLAQGAQLSKIISQLKADGQRENITFFHGDFTNDSIPDFVFRDTHNQFGGFYFYTCENSSYKVQTFWDNDPYAYLMDVKPIRDLNANGVPEFVISAAGVLVALEWNSDSFEETLRISDYGESYFEISNIDSSGLRKIVLSRGFPPHWNSWQEFPWRHYVSVYAWNGSEYSRVSKTFDSPMYQFQAIQDADQYALNGDYQKAIEMYQEAIFKNELGWWSPERRGYEFEKPSSSNESGQTTLSPAPSPDPAEYPRLAAYAYYRMIILHSFLGDMEAAQVKYATLQEKFPTESPGHPYVEMATDFWNAYQSGGLMYDACAAAIAYADSHPEILIPLGSDYHGMQSHTYTPADVCPFR